MKLLSRSLVSDYVAIILGFLLISALVLVSFSSNLHADAPIGTGEYYLVADTPAMPDGVGYGVSFKADSPYLAIANNIEDGGLSILDTDTLEIVEDTFLPVGNLSTLGFSPDGQYLAIGGDHLTILDTSASDPTEWSSVYTEDNEGAATSFTFSPDGDYLAIGYDGESPRRVEILNTSDWTEITDDGESFDFGLGSVHLQDVEFTPDSAYLLIGLEGAGDTETFVVVNTNDWTPVADVPQFENATLATSFAFSLDGQYLVAGLDASNESLGVMDISDADPANWTVVRQFSSNGTYGTWGVSFSPDGDTLAVAYRNSPYYGLIDTSDADPANWVEIDTSETIGDLDGGKAGNQGQGVAYSSDGRFIAIAESGGGGFALIRTPVPGDEEEEPEPEPEPDPTPVRHHRSSGGGSVQAQVTNLIENGDVAAADALKLKFPNLFNASVTEGLLVRDLEFGMSGADVMQLQTLLMSQGYAIPAGATGFFAGQTRAALSAYQSAHGITPAVGYFGPKTRAEMKSRALPGLWW